MEQRETSELIRQQADAIAHYRKVCDRLSAMARIGVWECELATDRLTWTDGVYDLFDLPRGSPPDRSVAVSMYEPASRRAMERERTRAIREGGGFSLDVLIRTPLGNERWIRLTADVEHEDGRPVRIFGTKQDVTGEKAAQARLESLQSELLYLSRESAMWTMAGTVAHEVNQPLAALSNYAAGLRRLAGPADAASPLSRGLAGIEASALRVSEIISRIRRLVQRRESRKEELNPGEILRTAAAYASGEFAGVAFEFDLAASSTIHADRVEIEQVAFNLVKYACEAVRHSAQRSVRLSTADAVGGVILSVANQRPAPPVLPNPYAAAVPADGDGLGISLSTCRTMIEANGGRIWVEALDPGSCIRFSLPNGMSATDAAAPAA